MRRVTSSTDESCERSPVRPASALRRTKFLSLVAYMCGNKCSFMRDPETAAYPSRRSVLQAVTGLGITALAGCSTQPTHTPKSTPTANTTTTAADAPLPSTGQINVILGGAEPWPDQFFNGNVDIELGVDVEGLRKQHFDQYKNIAQGKRKVGKKEQAQILEQFPHKLTDSDWVEKKCVPAAKRGWFKARRHV